MSLTRLLQESVLLNEGPNPDTQPSSLERKKAGEDLSKKQETDAEVRLHGAVVGACQLVPMGMPDCSATGSSAMTAPLDAARDHCRGVTALAHLWTSGMPAVASSKA